MRKKRLIIISSILSVLAVMIVLASTVFMLRSVEVDIVSSNNSVISEAQSDEIIKAAKFNYGGNVLFMNFSKQTERIEESFSYVKVEKIERKFPNKIVVHISERTPAAYAETDQYVYVLDKDLKILNVVAKAEFNSENPSLPQSALLVPKINITIPETAHAGAKLNDAEARYILQSIVAGVLKSGGEMIELSEISLSYEESTHLRILVSVHNRTLKIRFKGKDDLETKVWTGYYEYCQTADSAGVFEQLTETDYTFVKQAE